MSKVYCAGGAQTDFKRNWTKENLNFLDMLREITEKALQAANITPQDIRRLNEENKIAIFVGNFIAEKYVNQGHLGALLTEVEPAFAGVPSARYEAACASGSVALDAAITKIAADQYDVALVFGWEMMKTVSSKECGDILGCAALYEKEAQDVAFPFPKLFGKLAQETVNKYQLDERRYLNALAKISYKNYMNAKRNPLAQTRSWEASLEKAQTRGTEDNVLVGGLLAVTDCSQITDGAAGVVLVSEAYRKEKQLSATALVKGWGHRVAPMTFEHKLAESKENAYILPWTRQAVQDAYQRAGIAVEDVDFFETHDCFTSSEYAAISAFGITAPGKEYEAVENGVTEFEGRYPINPSGGLIGVGHPVGASGVRMFLDCYRQVTSQAGGYQLKKADIGVMLNIGGTATTNYVFVLGKHAE